MKPAAPKPTRSNRGKTADRVISEIAPDLTMWRVGMKGLVFKPFHLEFLMSRSSLIAAAAAVLIAGHALAQTPSGQTVPNAAAPAVAPVPATALSQAGVRQILGTFDTDGDGKISKAEWLVGGRQERRFVRFDIDADGFLVQAELRVAFELMAQMRASQGQ